MKMKTKIPTSQRGIALIAVLWVTAFLTIIASTVAHQSRTSLQMTKNRIDLLKVRQAAEGAILLTVADLMNAPGELDAFRGGEIGKVTIDNIEVVVTLFDESGKIDLNTAPTVILQSLLLEFGLDEVQSASVANAIADWRDQDSLVRAGGAEDAQYLSAGLGYGSKDGYFQRTEELSLVYGVSPQLYAALLPYVTVYTQDFGVNLGAASAKVRRAINKADQLRAELSSEEDEEFSEEDLLEDVEDFSSLAGGYIYTVQAKARNKNGVSKKYSAIIRLDRGNTYEPFTVLKWTQT